MALGFGWRSDNRRSSFTSKDIVKIPGDESPENTAWRVKREKLGGSYCLGVKVVVKRQAGTQVLIGRLGEFEPSVQFCDGPGLSKPGQSGFY